MLFCFTIHCLYMFGHGGHLGQVTFISILFYLLNKPNKIEFKQPSDFCNFVLETCVEVQNGWPWMKSQMSA